MKVQAAERQLAAACTARHSPPPALLRCASDQPTRRQVSARVTGVPSGALVSVMVSASPSTFIAGGEDGADMLTRQCSGQTLGHRTLLIVDGIGAEIGGVAALRSAVVAARPSGTSTDRSRRMNCAAKLPLRS